MAYASLQDFIPFYPLYALLFSDAGLSTGEISTLFVLWSLTSVVAEVPSGALADLVSRRALLVLAAVLYAGTFVVWVAVPSYPAFAIGFVLWGLSGAASSGAFEAYVYDTLSRHHEVRRYARVIARARAGGLLMNLAATLLAAPLWSVGGFGLVAAVSVAACVAQAAVALTLPADRRLVERAEEPSDDDDPGYRELLRDGLAEARRCVPVRHAVLLAAVLPAFLAFDEYFPLLGADLGAPRTAIPVLIAVTVAAQAAGAVLGGRCRPALVPPVLLAIGVLLTAGALSGRPVGFAGVAVGYGLLQMTIVVAEVRLQDAITGRARATVTSVAGLLNELCTIAVYAGFVLGAAWLPLTVLVALLAVVLVPVALLSRRWLAR